MAGGQRRPRAAGSEAPVTSARSTCPPRPRCSPGCTCGLAAADGKAGHWGVSRPVPRPAPRPLAPRILPAGALQAQTYPSASVTGRRVAGGAQGRRGSHSCGWRRGCLSLSLLPLPRPGYPAPSRGRGAGAQGTHSGKQAASHSQEGSLDRGHRLAGAAPGGGLALKPGGLVSDRERSSTGFVKDAVKQSTAFFPTLCSSRGQTVDLYTPHALQQQRSEFRPHEQALKHLKGTSISFILISKRHSIPASRGGGESCSSSPAPGGSPVPGPRHPPRT